jgi:RND family efflux transporter MFP subunit
LKVLEEYTAPKTIKELKSEVEKARSNELARQATWEMEKNKEAKLRRQVASCKMLAPSSGIIVYANDPNRFFGGPPQIEEGATVRERQKIFSIPDMRTFVVNTKVHESMIDRVTPGQKARVTVDAFPDQVLTGKVIVVFPLPDPTSFFSEAKAYTTRVKLDTFPAGLRPGMTARADMLITQLDHVLAVPVQAVLQYEGKDHVAVKTPDGRFEQRVVTLGATDTKVVEVKQGLKAGESVALNPISLMSAEEKRALTIQPTPPEPAKAKAKGSARSYLLPSTIQKLQNLSPDDRAQLKSATPEEREALLKKAGFTDEELRQLNAIRQRTPQKKHGDGPE